MNALRTITSGALIALGLAAGTAHASLTAFQTFVGNYGVSTDGWGSTSQSGTLTANVPAGATVAAAYLYTGTASNTTLAGVGGQFQGNNVSYTNLGTNSFLTAGRTDVTSIVQGVVGPIAAGGAYNFSITETSASQDGSALVVVYKLNSLAVSTVGILDGFSSSTGDATALNFSQALDPTAPGFFAEMRLGINFSCCNQRSTVTVNGTTITDNAGNNDDATEALSNGNLLTMGGDNDPFSTLMPAYANDHERYNLVPHITNGDTSIAITTINPSRDDNIFLAVFHVSGEAGVNAPPPTPTPEPATLALVGLALAAVGAQRRKSRR